MPSPKTTIDVVGVTGSAFGSALRGVGARELSTGACWLLGILVSDLHRQSKPRRNRQEPPPDRGRCAAEKRNAVVAEELRLRGRGQGKVKRDDAGAIRRPPKWAAPTSQRETVVFANHAQPDARSKPAERANLTTHGLTAPKNVNSKVRPDTYR